MEPISATIAAALALGASAALRETVETAVKDAYAGLKAIIKQRYAAASVDALEERPESEARRAAVQEDLERTSAGTDPEVLDAVKALVTLVSEQSPEVASAIWGVSIAEVEAQAIRISNVVSGQGGVVVRNSTVKGAIEIDAVHAGGKGNSSSKKA